MNYTEMMHVEADNLLYGRLTSILPELRRDYTGLAATPLTANKSFITASVFWIKTLESLQKFTKFLFEIAADKNEYNAYIAWLRPYACCKQGGVNADANGNGVKPFAVNEMYAIIYHFCVSILTNSILKEYVGLLS